MTAYLVKLALTLPLVAAMAWASLWLWRRYAPALRAAGQAAYGGDGPAGPLTPLRARLGAGGEPTPVRVTGAVGLGMAGRLVVVEFAGRSHLVAVTRQTIVPIATADEDRQGIPA